VAGDQPDQQATVEVQAQLAATETAASSGHVGIVAAITTPTSKRARLAGRNVPSARSSTTSPPSAAREHRIKRLYVSRTYT